MRPRILAPLAFVSSLGAAFTCALAAEPAATVRVIARDTTVRTDVAKASVRSREIHDVQSRGERTRLLVETVDSPVAIAVLFAGGKGAMRLSADGDIGWGNGNFLIRSRTLLLRDGITTAIIDAPTDRSDDLRYGFRGSAEHVADIGAVIAHLRAAYGRPVWLLGTSRGTNSVGNAAARLGANGPDGIAFSASMLESNENGNNLFDFDLEKISVPVLISHHEDDECRVTPPGNVRKLRDRLSGAARVEVRMYSGGNASGNACGVRHYHGFNGIEEAVMRDITKWIKAQAGK